MNFGAPMTPAQEKANLRMHYWDFARDAGLFVAGVVSPPLDFGLSRTICLIYFWLTNCVSYFILHCILALNHFRTYQIRLAGSDPGLQRRVFYGQISHMLRTRITVHRAYFFSFVRSAA
jgi:hypothetical protein